MTNQDCRHEVWIDTLPSQCAGCRKTEDEMETPTTQDWKERIKEFQFRYIAASCGHEHKRESLDKLSKEMIDFIAQEIEAAEERGRREVIEAIEERYKISGGLSLPSLIEHLKAKFNF